MTEAVEDRRTAVIAAEEAILALRRKMDEYDGKAQTLGGSLKLIDAACTAMKRYDAALDGLTRHTSATVSELKALSGTASEEIRKASESHQIEIRGRAEEVAQAFGISSRAALADIQRIFKQQQEETLRQSASILATVDYASKRLTGVIKDVRSTAATAESQVVRTYTDAQTRFERARDEFAEARKEVIGAASELRATLIRLEVSQRDFQVVLTASLRRIERVLYSGIVIVLGGIIGLFLMGR